MKKSIVHAIAFITLISLSNFSKAQYNLDSIYLSAISHYNSGQYSKAIENFSELLKIDVDKGIKKRLYINRALAYRDNLDYDDAVIDFTKAIELDSSDMATFLDRGLSYYFQRNFERAELDFNYVRNKNTNAKMFENATYWLTKIEFSRMNFPKAIDYSNELIKLNEKDSEFYFLRGTAYSNLREYENAISDYDRALKIQPKYLEALTNRGIAKVNLFSKNPNLQPTRRQRKSACADLKKAFDLGDIANTEDLIFIYCQ